MKTTRAGPARSANRPKCPAGQDSPCGPAQEPEGVGPGLDTGVPEIARTASARWGVAFDYAEGRLREFVFAPSSSEWCEVSPCDLLNRLLKHAQPSLRRLLQRYEWFLDETFEGLLAASEQEPWREVSVVPTEVTLGIAREGQRLARWVHQRGHSLAYDPRSPYFLRLIDCKGRAVPVPKEWRKLTVFLAEDVERVVRPWLFRWRPALSYWSEVVPSLCWVEAIVAKQYGGKVLSCRAGHRFVWVGRSSKRWCPEHHREVEALEARWRRSIAGGRASSRAHELEQALRRLGYWAVRQASSQKGGRQVSSARPRGAMPAGRPRRIRGGGGDGRGQQESRGSPRRNPHGEWVSDSG